MEASAQGTCQRVKTNKQKSSPNNVPILQDKMMLRVYASNVLGPNKTGGQNNPIQNFPGI